jgi:hypothetical protein
MYKTISNAIIRKFNPCYDPSKVITDETEELSVKQWVEKYRKVVPTKDILWLLSRKEFMSEKDLILFVVWCAREALKFVENPDERIVEACNVAERYANGEATKEELHTAHDAALVAAYAAFNIGGYTVAYHVYYAAYYTAAITIATANAVIAAANVGRVASHASDAAALVALAVSDAVSRADADDAAADAADATRAAQIDKLLTYFE